MAEFKPALPFNSPFRLLVPFKSKVNGVVTKTYPEVENGELIFASFKTYGGTESETNGVYTVIDTADVQTWYHPDIKSDCIITNAETGEKYEIIGAPENINMRNQFLKFKVKRIKGGA